MEYLAWPAVVLILGIFALFMFKRNIAGRIDKIQKIERIGVSIGTEQQQPSPEAKDSGFNQVMDATSSPLLREREIIIRDALKTKNITNQEEIIKVLTRALASSQLTSEWISIDRDIFGSQLAALVAINAAPSGFTNEQLKVFYAQATTAFPATYENFSFEQWLKFLEAFQLIAPSGQGFQITLRGKDFMSWLVTTGRTHQRPN